jgi:hypothetical protein
VEPDVRRQRAFTRTRPTSRAAGLVGGRRGFSGRRQRFLNPANFTLANGGRAR